MRFWSRLGYWTNRRQRELAAGAIWDTTLIACASDTSSLMILDSLAVSRHILLPSPMPSPTSDMTPRSSLPLDRYV